MRGVCLDIDDTLSTHGKLTAQAYQALWKLHEAGFWVLPITGRPAGWCDLIARFWPVHAVVGENGGFSMEMEPREGGAQSSNRVLRTRFTNEEAWRITERELPKLRADILQHFPHVKFASDQAYRKFDLAVDFCEDVEPWSDSEVLRLKRFCEERGANAKVSSIHLNTWFGDFDKCRGFEVWQNRHPEAPTASEWLFIGDSPNDEPLFHYFPMSVGVANVKKFLPQMKSPPTFLTDLPSGQGFCEMAEQLLAHRKTS